MPVVNTGFPISPGEGLAVIRSRTADNARVEVIDQRDCSILDPTFTTLPQIVVTDMPAFRMAVDATAGGLPVLSLEQARVLAKALEFAANMEEQRYAV